MSPTPTSIHGVPHENVYPQWEVSLAVSSTMEIIADLTDSTNKQLQLQLNRPGQLTGTTRFDSPAAPYILPWKFCVRAFRNGDEVWSGPFQGIEQNLPDRSITWTAVGWFELLHHRFLELDDDLVITDKDAAEHVRQLLAATNADIPVPITIGETDPSQSRTNTYVKLANIGDEIFNLSQLESGFDMAVDPTTRQLSIYYKPIIGEIRGMGEDKKNVLFEYGSNIISAQRQLDGTTVTNKIHVQGTGDTVSQIDYESISKFGLFTTTESLSNVGGEGGLNILQAFAAAEVAVKADPRVTINFAPQASGSSNVPQPFSDYNVGDAVYVTIKDGPFNTGDTAAISRIFGMTLSIDDNERVTLETTFMLTKLDYPEPPRTTSTEIGPQPPPPVITHPPTDITPPNTTITSGPSNGEIVTTSTVTFTFTSNEAGSTFEYIDGNGNWHPCASPLVYGPLQVGPNGFAVRATDPAGNVDPSPDGRLFTYDDQTAIDTIITSGPANGSVITDTTPTFTFVSTVPGATFEVSVDGGAYVAASSPYTLSARSDDNYHSFQVRSIDGVNVDQTSALRVFYVNTTPPPTGVLPYSVPSPTTARTVFAWYMAGYPISIDNINPNFDFYVDATDQHSTTYAGTPNIVQKGGFMRERPLGRLPRDSSGGGYAYKDMQDEVARAKAAGIDGFMIDMMDFDVGRATPSAGIISAQKLIDAAEADGSFKIIVAADLIGWKAGGGVPPVAQLAASIAPYLASSAAYREPDTNKRVLGVWDPTIDDAARWTLVKNALLSTHGIDVLLLPTFNSAPGISSAWGPISYAQTVWGVASPGQGGAYTSQANLARSFGSAWAQPIKVEDDRPGGAIMWEAGNTETLREGWSYAQVTNAEMAIIITWNDYGESFCAPSDSFGYFWCDFIGYLIGRYKANGTVPTVTQDAVWFSYRRHKWSQNPMASYGNTQLMIQMGSFSKRNSVEIVVFATQNSTIELLNNNSVIRTWTVGAGVAVLYDQSVGLPIGNLSVRQTHTGYDNTTYAVMPTTNKPHYQDYRYKAVQSTRRSPLNTATRGDDEIRWRGTSWHPFWASPDVDREFNLIKTTGANCVRFDVGWQNLEPTQGTYDVGYVSTMDAVMFMCSRNGMKVIINLITSPPWARSGGVGDNPPDSGHRDEYAAAAAFLADRYRNALCAFEVWNEPNNPGGGAISASTYALLVNPAYLAVKSVAPEMSVIVGSTAGCDVAYTQAVVSAGAAYDGWSVHPYSGKYAPNPGYNVTNSMIPGLPTIFNIVKKPLWVTEFGWSTLTGDAFYSVDEATQAARYAQAWAVLNSLQYVKAATQYNMVENGTANDLWSNWGLVERNTWRQKPAWQAHTNGVGS